MVSKIKDDYIFNYPLPKERKPPPAPSFGKDGAGSGFC